jgi:DNA-binding MarR family transcriptional regulator
MPDSPRTDYLTGIFHETMVALVRRDGPDLSARQMAVLLTCYMIDAPHTVRGLALALNVSKPAITRALDRLTDFDLIRRKIDSTDRRSVLIQRTAKGAAFLRELRMIMSASGNDDRDIPAAAPMSRRRTSPQSSKP